MSRLNVMIEEKGRDPEYSNWISLVFDPENDKDLEFAYELQKRAIDQGYQVIMKKDEE